MVIKQSGKGERVVMTDPRTGVKVIQVTSYPTPSAHFVYDWPSITPDNRWLVLFCQRFGRRDAPWDIFRTDSDGLRLHQLTMRGDRAEKGGYYGRASAVLTLDGQTIYVVWGTTLARVDVETGTTEDLLSLEQHCPEGSAVGHISLSWSGERLFMRVSGPRQTDLRVDLRVGEVHELDLGGAIFGTVRGEARIVVQRGKVVWGTETSKEGHRAVTNVGDVLALWSTDEDGGDARFLCPQIFAHATPIGPGRRIQGPGKPPHRCIFLADEGNEPEKLVEGPYFWHSAASMDGEWIVSDTNWPDEGLQLVHVPTGHFRTLCHPGATLAHVEYGHPHPTIGHDGRLVAFRSDRTGMSQMYLAHVSEEFRESVIAGELDRPKDKWM